MTKLDVGCLRSTYLSYNWCTMSNTGLPQVHVTSLSCMVLVIITMESMASVRWPYHGHIFTHRRRWISVFNTTFVLNVINIPVFWMATENNGDTSIHFCKVAHVVIAYQIWPWGDLSIHSFLPFMIMISCSTIIIKTVLQRRKTLLRRGCGNG